MRIIQWISSLQTYKEIWSRTEFCLNLLISKINFRLVLNYPCWNGNNQNLKVNLINVISYIYIYCPCHIWPLKLPQQTCQLSRLYLEYYDFLFFLTASWQDYQSHGFWWKIIPKWNYTFLHKDGSLMRNAKAIN